LRYGGLAGTRSTAYSNNHGLGHQEYAFLKSEVIESDLGM
jgi:hypothetical protein